MFTETGGAFKTCQTYKFERFDQFTWFINRGVDRT